MPDQKRGRMSENNFFLFPSMYFHYNLRKAKIDREIFLKSWSFWSNQMMAFSKDWDLCWKRNESFLHLIQRFERIFHRNFHLLSSTWISPFNIKALNNWWFQQLCASNCLSQLKTLSIISNARNFWICFRERIPFTVKSNSICSDLIGDMN